ncbi:MAG TPA: Atxe2 family lasso peptide isopeptidase [Caulobacteraceae bacterium]|jgi:dipeptidyl aminopeptidase/acylaminoacyl peptidase
MTFLQTGRAMLFAGICAAAWPAGAAPSPKMLVELADLSSVAISPEGRSVAFREDRASVDRNDYAGTWLVRSLDGEVPALPVGAAGGQLHSDYGGVVSEPPQWSSDSRWIYYRALLNGEVQVWRAARDGSKAEPVTHDPSDIGSFVLSPDGLRLVYTVGATREAIERAERQDYDQGVLIDAQTPIGQNLFRSGWINGRLSTQRLAQGWANRQGLLSGAPQHQRVVDLASLADHEAGPADLAEFASVQPVATLKAAPQTDSISDLRVRSPATGEIAFLVTEGSVTRLRMARGSESTTWIPCPAPECQDRYISALAWRPGHDQIVFTTIDRDRGHAQSLYLWDIKPGVVRPIVHAEGLISGGRNSGIGESCAVGEAALVCVTAAADTPPQLERVAFEGGARRVLYDPNAALAAAAGPRVTPLHWSDGQGHNFVGAYFPPVQAHPGPAPLFLTYYGCVGYLRGGVGDEWPLASLAGAGIAAVCIDEPAQDPKHMDQLVRYQIASSGIHSLVDRLSGEGLVDRTKVGMGGLSFGSETTVWLAMTSDLLAAASVTSTSLTPSYYRFHALQGPGFKASLTALFGLGAPEEAPDRWRQMSPVFHVGQIHTPLLMQMPEQEYLQALDYFVPLAKSPTPAEMYVFPNEPHLKTEPRHKLAAYERNLDWFRFWLQGFVDPDPQKAEQYRRWQAMKARFAASRSAQHDGLPAASTPGA